MILRRLALAALAMATVTTGPVALADPPPFAVPPAWTRPTAPFHIVGPIWYVGSEGLASYLIRTPAGAILVDGTMAQNVPGILRNIRAIGVRPRDIRLLLVTHAHFDHVGGDAAMVRATGARVFAGARDVPALESGIPPGEVDYRAVSFPPVHVTRGVRDGDLLRFGGLVIRAVATPGHTPGCTSWDLSWEERGGPFHVLFLCSLTPGGNRLVGNRRYPGIVTDYRHSFDRLATWPADVVLPAHPEIADVMKHRQDGLWVDRGQLPRIVANARQDFDRELARQRAAAGRTASASQ